MAHFAAKRGGSDPGTSAQAPAQKKPGGFSGVKTIAQFLTIYECYVNNPSDLFEPPKILSEKERQTLLLPVECLEILSKTVGADFSHAARWVRMLNEKGRYLAMYDILRIMCKAGRTRLVLSVPGTVDTESEEQPCEPPGEMSKEPHILKYEENVYGVHRSGSHMFANRYVFA